MQKNKRLYILLTLVLVILAVPFLAMQFSSEVAWTLSDFIVAGIFLLLLVFLLEVILRKIKSKKFRLLMLIFLFICFLLMWIEMAVGLFNTPFAGN